MNGELKNDKLERIVGSQIAQRYQDLEKVINIIEQKKSLSRYESIEYYNKILEMNDIRFMATQGN